MSLIICVHVEEGIVLASDSKITYNKKNGNIEYIGVHSTNTTDKTFKCPNNSGIAICGNASIKGKPITGFIEAFIREKVQAETDIDDMPEMIKEYFEKLEPTLSTHFLIAGYKKINEKVVQRIYKVVTNNLRTRQIEKINTESQGAVWDGETITLTKLLTTVYTKIGNEYIPLQEPELAWNYYTLQDAIDFAKYGIKTTIDTMRFQTGCKTVGEPIDILVIKPDSAEWLIKKELKG